MYDVLLWCSVHWTYRFCTTPLHWLNFLLFLTFSATFNYGNAFRFPIFILEPGVIEESEVSPDLTYEQHSIRIIASEVERLRNKDVLLVKVQWFSDPKDCSWESWEFIERSRLGLPFHALYGELPISNLFCVDMLL